MKKTLTILLSGILLNFSTFAQYKFDNILYGATYYHEYIHYELLDEDIRMMKDAGLSVVRVSESSWALFEPQEGVFEFAWMDRIRDKMHTAGIYEHDEYKNKTRFFYPFLCKKVFILQMGKIKKTSNFDARK